MNDVVVADDNQALLGILSEIFKERGYTVRTAEDGFAALTSIRERVPDILISDLNMPRMSGFELLSIVRRRLPSIAVLAISGAYSRATAPRGIAADAFYAKGSSNIGRLFEILYTIKDEAARRTSRAAAPIWIPDLPIHEDGLLTISVACAECLRDFSHLLRGAESLYVECCCPHCRYPMSLAIAAPSLDVDRTGFETLISTVRTIVPACTR